MASLEFDVDRWEDDGGATPTLRHVSWDCPVDPLDTRDYFLDSGNNAPMVASDVVGEKMDLPEIMERPDSNMSQRASQRH